MIGLRFSKGIKPLAFEWNVNISRALTKSIRRCIKFYRLNCKVIRLQDRAVGQFLLGLLPTYNNYLYIPRGSKCGRYLGGF